MKFIETTNEGVHCYNRFSADFSDDIVKLNNRNYPLGAVSKMVANISKEEMDVLLQLGGKVLNCYKTISLLGYNRNVFLISALILKDPKSWLVIYCRKRLWINMRIVLTMINRLQKREH